jgi:hypothetical protein
VQFCWNGVTGMIAAPALALVSVWSVIAAQCRFFVGCQGEIARNYGAFVIAGLDPAIHPVGKILSKNDGYAGQARV